MAYIMVGDSYIGEWKEGNADGFGVHTWINGIRLNELTIFTNIHTKAIDMKGNLNNV